MRFTIQKTMISIIIRSRIRSIVNRIQGEIVSGKRLNKRGRDIVIDSHNFSMRIEESFQGCLAYRKPKQPRSNV